MIKINNIFGTSIWHHCKGIFIRIKTQFCPQEDRRVYCLIKVERDCFSFGRIDGALCRHFHGMHACHVEMRKDVRHKGTVFIVNGSNKINAERIKEES